MTRLAELSSRWRVRAGYPLAIIYYWLAKPSAESLAIGAVLAALGLLARGAAAGHLRKQEALATGGPYAYTRNPLYFGSALIAVGLCLAAWSWLATALLAAYFVVFYPAVMRREAAELRARHGAVFDSYAAEVPLFFPRLRAGSPGQGRFSWAQYRKNREYNAALGTLAGWVLLWLRMRLPF